MSSISPKEASAELLKLTTTVTASYLGNNKVSISEVPELIKSVFAALGNNGAEIAAPAKAEPAVPIKKSIHRDYLVCLEDGKRLKMLKRHLKSTYDMTPDEYRAKWGLPTDYPMTAPGYAESRSTLAKAIGLGRAKPQPAAPEVAESEAPKARKGRKPRS